MKLEELKETARKYNLKNWSKFRKPELIKFLNENIPQESKVEQQHQESSFPRYRTLSPIRSKSNEDEMQSGKPVLQQKSLNPIRFYDKLKKKPCEKNLRKDVVSVAEDYGISIKKPNGKNKTIKELCAELNLIVGESTEMKPSKIEPAKIDSVEPVAGPAGLSNIVPRDIVFNLTDIDEQMDKSQLLKPGMVTKNQLVLYAEKLGIKGKSLVKEVLLDRIIAANKLKNQPLKNQEIAIESSIITSEISNQVSQNIEEQGGSSPYEKQIQSIVEQRLSTGEPINATEVANEIVAEQQNENIIENTLDPISNSFVSTSIRSAISDSLNIAQQINEKISDNIKDELNKIDNKSTEAIVNKIINKQPLDVNPNDLKIKVSDDRVRNAVEDVVANYQKKGLISNQEKQEILNPIKEIHPIPGPSGLQYPGGARPKVRPLPQPQVLPRSQPQIPQIKIQRTVKNERDIEKLLNEIQKSEESISNITLIQKRIFECLGLVN